MYAAPSSDGLPEKGSSCLPDEALWVGGGESRAQYQTQDLSQRPSFLSLLWIWIRYNIASVLYWFSGHKAYGILAPQRGIKSIPPVLEGSLNHRTTREVPLGSLLHTPQPLGEGCDCYLCVPPSIPDSLPCKLYPLSTRLWTLQSVKGKVYLIFEPKVFGRVFPEVLIFLLKLDPSCSWAFWRWKSFRKLKSCTGYDLIWNSWNLSTGDKSVRESTGKHINNSFHTWGL